MKTLILFIVFILYQPLYSDNSDKGIKFIEDGIYLYEKFFFESSLGGDKFLISDLNHTEIIPPGVVLTVLKPAYTIGYFIGGIEVKEADKITIIKKVFFELNVSGKVKFYYPSEDESFLGKEIKGTVTFKAR